MPVKNIRVLSITQDHKRSLAIAEVRGTSSERIQGRPVASVRMEVRIEALPGEPKRKTSERAKDEALKFLKLTDSFPPSGSHLW